MADLYPSAPIIVTGYNHVEGVLGVVVQDGDDGHCYGLTSRALFVSDQPALTADGTNRRVGKLSPKFDAPRDRSRRVVPIIELVGFIDLNRSLSLSDENPTSRRKIAGTAAAKSLLASTLYVIPPARPAIPAQIVGFGVTFDLDTDGGGLITVEGGLELAPPQGPIGLNTGDAGAPVVTQSGQLVGLVVAINRDACIVAPLHETFVQHGLKTYLRQAPVPAAAKATTRSWGDAAEPMVGGNPRIAGVTIPGRKRVAIALQYIHGIGATSAAKICKALDLPDGLRANALTNSQVLALREHIETNYVVEGDLRRQKAADIKRLVDLACYRGLRHRKGLPVRGQRTHTNARTRKGKAIPIAGKKK